MKTLKSIPIANWTLINREEEGAKTLELVIFYFSRGIGAIGEGPGSAGPDW
jgi:hypothetical protein